MTGRKEEAIRRDEQERMTDLVKVVIHVVMPYSSYSEERVEGKNCRMKGEKGGC